MICAAIGITWNMAGSLCSPDLDDCSSIAAIADGYDAILDGDSIAVITGATDDLTFDMFMKSCEMNGLLTKNDIMQPMTVGSNGSINSLGAGAIMLE